MQKLDFEHEYILENDRIKLIPLKHEDYLPLLPYAIKEPDLWSYSLVSAKGKKGMRNYVDKALVGREDKTQYPFVIQDKKTSNIIGSTRFYNYLPDHDYIYIGYTWLGKKYWGTGINRNIKCLMLKFAFETIGIQRVQLEADADNIRSIKAMEKIGATVEGVLRSTYYREDGSRRNSIVLSILKEEWFGTIKNSLP